MNDEKRVAWTMRLVLAGIILGYVSYGTVKLGVGELYPFAAWRLYSEPIGINQAFTTYRIYARNAPGQPWERQSKEPTRAFTRNEITYALGYWSRQTVEPGKITPRARRALQALADSLAPDASQYRIVAESFYSLPFFEDSTRYDTSTVALLDG